MTKSERYSRLAPLHIIKKIIIAKEACLFFSPLNYRQMCEGIGLVPEKTILPLSVYNFITHLEKNLEFTGALKYQYRIKLVLDSMEQAGILTPMGTSTFVTAPRVYYFLREFTEIEKRGTLWLAPALGPEYIKHLYKEITIHLVGTTPDGSEHAGTGILIDKNHILTCAHVINDMKLYDQQDIQGRRREIADIATHPKIDVGIITLTDGEATPNKSFAFREPEVSERVHTLGFPRIPLSRNPALIMQSGEVVSEEILTIHGDAVFLYSAIARPGNSGGPIISSSGYIVGIVSQDLSMKDAEDAPFYAGVPTKLIQLALEEIAPTLQLPIETYE